MNKKIYNLTLQITILSILISNIAKADPDVEIEKLTKDVRDMTLNKSLQTTENVDLVFGQINQVLNRIKENQGLNTLKTDELSNLVHKTTNAAVSLLLNSDANIQEVSLIKLNNLIVLLKQANTAIESLNASSISAQMQSELNSVLSASLSQIKSRLIKFINSPSIQPLVRKKIVHLVFDNTEQFINYRPILNSEDLLLSIEGTRDDVNEFINLTDYEKNLMRFMLNNSDEISFTKENLLFLETARSEYSDRELTLNELTNLIDISAKFAKSDNNTFEKTNSKLISIVKTQTNMNKLLSSTEGLKKLNQFVFLLIHQNNLLYANEGINLLTTVLKATVLQSSEMKRKEILNSVIEQLGLKDGSSLLASISSHNRQYQYTIKQLIATLKTKALPIARQISGEQSETLRTIETFLSDAEKTHVNSDNGLPEFINFKRHQGSLILECRQIMMNK